MNFKNIFLQWLLFLNSSLKIFFLIYFWPCWVFTALGSSQLPELWFPVSAAVAVGLAAPRHVGSSWIRDWTCVSCISRRILYHWATRDASLPPFKIFIWFTFRYFWLITLCQSVIFKKLNIWLSHQYRMNVNQRFSQLINGGTSRM